MRGALVNEKKGTGGGQPLTKETDDHRRSLDSTSVKSF